MQGNFNSIIQSTIPVLVDFYADWCQPCKVQSPILQELAREQQGRLRIVKINVDKNPEISNRYRVQSIPTLMLFKSGQMVWKHSGVLPKPQLTEVVKSFQNG
ncbi:MAG: thioredoxin [Prolixibacteraceae bacterium]|jgi:thioredoxin 1